MLRFLLTTLLLCQVLMNQGMEQMDKDVPFDLIEGYCYALRGRTLASIMEADLLIKKNIAHNAINYLDQARVTLDNLRNQGVFSLSNYNHVKQFLSELREEINPNTGVVATFPPVIESMYVYAKNTGMHHLKELECPALVNFFEEMTSFVDNDLIKGDVQYGFRREFTLNKHALESYCLSVRANIMACIAKTEAALKLEKCNLMITFLDQEINALNQLFCIGKISPINYMQVKKTFRHGIDIIKTGLGTAASEPARQMPVEMVVQLQKVQQTSMNAMKRMGSPTLVKFLEDMANKVENF